MAVNVVAVVVLLIFYLVILAVGLFAAYRLKAKGTELETSVVAGRDLKTSVGIFTMIATTVGGGFINGTAEEIARAGLVWTLAPFAIFIGLNIGGAVYAKKMRSARYLTMLDPFQAHQGNLVTLFIYSASLVGDLLWTASILNALAVGLFAAYRLKAKGTELETSVVAGRDLKTSVGIFTMIATTVGGGFINGTAEEIARAGLVWTLAPFAIFIGLNIGGAVYAKKMRSARYLTMLDPFQAHQGNLVTLFIYSASLVGDLLWTASILNALAVGLFAAYRLKAKGTELETSVVAGRDLKTSVGIFTMIATTVGGGFINGTAEEIARAGLVWTLAPFAIFIGLNIGGAVYAKKMRSARYLTMLDPFQAHQGNLVTLFIYSASLVGDLLWTASILNALGTTLSVIADIDLLPAVLMSGSVTIIYTMLGSMISVAYTDVVQLMFILLGLLISLPFVFSNDKIGSFHDTQSTWLGHVSACHTAVWVDLFVAMTLGTIPWQSYFQRVLSMKSAKQAQILSCVGAVGALVLAVPPALIGIAGASADWSNTTIGVSPVGTNQSSLILPLVIHEFTPEIVSLFGLGAISAAVMSSMDSSILGTSSMFTHNIYHEMFRNSASKLELRGVQMMAVVFFGTVAMAIAVLSNVIYGIFILAADIVFVIIFPQLTAVLFLPDYVNPAGCIAAFLLGLTLRLGAGEPIVDLPAWILFPFYSEAEGGQLFPFRTVSMLLSFSTIILVTSLTRLIKCGNKSIMASGQCRYKWLVGIQTRCHNEDSSPESDSVTMYKVDTSGL